MAISAHHLPCEIVWVHRGVIKSTQVHSVAIGAHHLPFEMRGSRDVIKGNQVHSVAISAHHLPFEIAWVNCGTDKREHETTPHMPQAPCTTLGRQLGRQLERKLGRQSEMTPHMPHAPCAAQASTGSSICIKFIIMEEAISAHHLRRRPLGRRFAIGSSTWRRRGTRSRPQRR